MSIIKHAVIAAAGLGSRLGHGKPKCLVRFENVSLLAHQLSLLADVPDVRVVVGFMEVDVIEELTRVRRDAIVVRNPGFRSTTTLHSYALGARGLVGDCLFMDADLLIAPESFHAFLASCRLGEARLALTEAKTTDAVFVEMEGDMVTGFRRNEPAAYEWSNISWLPVSLFEKIEHTTVYEHLHRYLPMMTGMVNSWEIDTSEDLERAKAKAKSFDLIDHRPIAAV